MELKKYRLIFVLPLIISSLFIIPSAPDAFAAIPTVEATQVYDQTSNASTTGAQTLSLGTISTGDIVFVFIALDGTAGNPSGSGNNSGALTCILNPDQGNVEGEVCYAIQGGTPDTTITINWTGSEQGRFMYVRVAGADTADVVDVVGASLTGSNTSATPVSSASTEANTLFLSFVAVDRDGVDGADTVSGTGWTEVGVSGSSGGANGAGLIVAELDQASIGTPANAVYGTWASDEYATFTFNVNEDAGGTPTYVINNMDIYESESTTLNSGNAICTGISLTSASECTGVLYVGHVYRIEINVSETAGTAGSPTTLDIDSAVGNFDLAGSVVAGQILDSGCNTNTDWTESIVSADIRASSGTTCSINSSSADWWIVLRIHSDAGGAVKPTATFTIDDGSISDVSTTTTFNVSNILEG